jgi:Holliday junction resolvase-like predicted endonuclease
LDIILTKGDSLFFVEVKVVDHIEDLDGYVTMKKIGFLQKAIDYYLMKHPSDQEIILDVAFVQNNHIIEIYENVTNS